MVKTVFLTGATGFLGTWIVRDLLEKTRSRIAVLVRAPNRESALFRLNRIWWEMPLLREALNNRIDVFCGDVRLPDLGLRLSDRRVVVRNVTHIIHAAADLRFSIPIQELRRTNVLGTGHVLELASEIVRDRGLSRFSHVSTVAVAGAARGLVRENEAGGRNGFFNPYEQSKAEAEELVRKAVGYPVTIFRPGMIVGDSRTGAVRTFNTMYVPLRILLTKTVSAVPGDPEMRLWWIPVDRVAGIVVKMTFDLRAAGLCLHAILPPSSSPRLREWTDWVREWARENLDLRIPRVRFFRISANALRTSSRILAGLNLRFRKGPFLTWHVLLPYLGSSVRFERKVLDRLEGSPAEDWRSWAGTLLTYAVDHGFLHGSDRTVHEQILFRLKSRTRPVTFHDIENGRVRTRKARDVGCEIRKAVASLAGLGFRAGDRAAIMGPNSIRQMILDTAIGLAGGITVPLYPSFPPCERNVVLAHAGAKVLFFGDSAAMKNVDGLPNATTLVAFGRYPASLENRTVLQWDDFLALGGGSLGPESSPAGFDSPATIRYTSGTTGPAKGVVFLHGQLRWMGRTMASLFPWKSRIRRVSALSYLPSNHVVEGILAACSIWYVPAPVDLFFLDRFQDLKGALVLSRPKVFFSVPRFYEKLWEAASSRRIVRRVLERDQSRFPSQSRSRINDRFQRALAHAIGRKILKKAGLDKCVQLIVGSAPSSDELWTGFRKFGIEVHNAYGLTEAPLVTINRLGSNRIGTVGQPLPRTEIVVARDREILIRGPQVTSGFFRRPSDGLFRDGWLLTGDLGRITPEGDLVIEGRKKECLVTSYGKNVVPGKIEIRLRQIPGITEAMLVGEGRPFCTALLWTRQSGPITDAVPTVRRGVEDVNADLSQPERVRRWALLSDDLSIEGGDLTANLKLRRPCVMQRFAPVIDALYGKGRVPAEVLEEGSAGQEGMTP